MTDQTRRCRRRRIVSALGVAAVALLAALPARAAAQATAVFEILRDGEPIGEHVIRYGGEDDTLEVAIRTRIAVGLLGITLYRYEHESRETWRREDGRLRLVELTARTDDNGERFALDGQAASEGFRVSGETGSYTAPAEVIPSSYWNVELAGRSRLLGTKRGQLYEIEVEDRGYAPIEAAEDYLEARHFRIVSDPEVSLWYDEEGYLRRLAFRKDGEFIDYRLAEFRRR